MLLIDIIPLDIHVLAIKKTFDSLPFIARQVYCKMQKCKKNLSSFKLLKMEIASDVPNPLTSVEFRKKSSYVIVIPWVVCLYVEIIQEL